MGQRLWGPQDTGSPVQTGGTGSPPSCPVELSCPPPPSLSRAFPVQNCPSLGWHFSRSRAVGKTYASSTDHIFRAFAPLNFSQDTRGDISLACRCQAREQHGYATARAEQRRSVYSAPGKDTDSQLLTSFQSDLSASAQALELPASPGEDAQLFLMSQSHVNVICHDSLGCNSPQCGLVLM